MTAFEDTVITKSESVLVLVCLAVCVSLSLPVIQLEMTTIEE